MAEINVSQETGDNDSDSIDRFITCESLVVVLLWESCRPSNSLHEMLRAKPISCHLALIFFNSKTASLILGHSFEKLVHWMVKNESCILLVSEN